MINVFLLAENRLLREAMVRMLSKKDDLVVVGASGLCAETAQQVRLAKPDVLVADRAIQTNGTTAVFMEFRKLLPDVKIVMIGMDEDRETFLRAVRDGIAGYVLKEASAVEVLNAVRSAASGEAVCPPRLCMTLFKYVSSQWTQTPSLQIRRDLALTPREQQLLQSLSRGLTNKEIAIELNLSEQTVKNHVHRILRKVGASDRLTVVELYRLHGLVSSAEG